MFLVLKLAERLLLPSNLIAVVMMLGLAALLLRRLRAALNLLVAGAVLLAIGGWSPLGPFLLDVLESRFPAQHVVGDVAGIVMLGGAVDVHITRDRGQPALTDAAERVTATAVLSRRFPNARILLSGGAGHAARAQPSATESSIARDLLVGMGVDPHRIALEDTSRTTCENAKLSVGIAVPKLGEQWLLVTSASHMPRAVACFRAATFPVTPYPVDYRTRGSHDMRHPTESIAAGLAELDLASHEWLGLIGYRLSGQTRDLFPGPEVPPQSR